MRNKCRVDVQNLTLSLPPELHDTAQVLAGEPAWPAVEALQVVDWLGKHGYEVVGVELWREQNGHPLWIATSDYASSPPAQKIGLFIHWGGISSMMSSEAMMPATVTRSALQAAQFITKHQNKPGALMKVQTGQAPRYLKDRILGLRLRALPDKAGYAASGGELTSR